MAEPPTFKAHVLTLFKDHGTRAARSRAKKAVLKMMMENEIDVIQSSASINDLKSQDFFVELKKQERAPSATTDLMAAGVRAYLASVAMADGQDGLPATFSVDMAVFAMRHIRKQTKIVATLHVREARTR